MRPLLIFFNFSISQGGEAFLYTLFDPVRPTNFVRKNRMGSFDIFTKLAHSKESRGKNIFEMLRKWQIGCKPFVLDKYFNQC